MRYKDVANRLVASPALPIDKKTAFDAVSMPVVVLRAYQRARCLCQVLCLLIINVGAATGRLVTSLYHTVSPRKAVTSLLFARVINLIIVIVIVNNFCIVMVRIYNFVANKGIFQ